jgi:hypothetical protein
MTGRSRPDQSRTIATLRERNEYFPAKPPESLHELVAFHGGAIVNRGRSYEEMLASNTIRQYVNAAKGNEHGEVFIFALDSRLSVFPAGMQCNADLLFAA